MSDDFQRERDESISHYSTDTSLQEAMARFRDESIRARYSYNFDWLGRPIIQYPQDIVAMQELVWQVRPDLIIETGIAHGGSIIFSASMMALLEYCDAAAGGEEPVAVTAKRKVLAIDIDIRAHNRAAIETHPMFNRIDMIEGSSIDEATISRVHEYAAPFKNVLVVLDSNHTHDHVLAELEAYAPLTSIGSYCVVFDTIIEDLPDSFFADRPWGVGNNAKTAVHEFLETNSARKRQGVDGSPLDFRIDTAIHDKLLITAAPSGYLRRV